MNSNIEHRPRIAWVSPLSGEGARRSVHYSTQLLPFLAERFDIECFVDDIDFDNLADDTSLCSCSVFHYHRLYERASAAEFDCIVYQLEDSVRSQFVRLCSHVFPGLTILHDTSFNSLYYGLFEFTTAPTELNELLSSEFGPSAPRVGDFHVRGWSYEVFGRRYSCGRSDLRQMKHIVVSRPDQRDYLHSMGLTGRIDTIAYPSPAPATELNVSASEFASRGPKVVFSGERALADRFNSFLIASAELESCIEEIVWLHPDGSAQERCEAYTRVFAEARGLTLAPIRHVVVHNSADILAELMAANVTYISLRTAIESSFCLGFEEALALGCRIICTQAQLCADHGLAVYAIPEGIGDDLWLSKLLRSFVTTQPTPHASTMCTKSPLESDEVRIRRYVDMPQVVSTQIAKVIETRQDALTGEYFERQQRIQLQAHALLTGRTSSMNMTDSEHDDGGEQTAVPVTCELLNQFQSEFLASFTAEEFAVAVRSMR